MRRNIGDVLCQVDDTISDLRDWLIAECDAADDGNATVTEDEASDVEFLLNNMRVSMKKLTHLVPKTWRKP